MRNKEYALKQNWNSVVPVLSRVKSLMENDHQKKREFVKKALEDQKASGNYLTN